MKGVTVPGSNSPTEKLRGSGLGLGKISEGPEQPGLFKGLICFLHLSPLGDRGGGGGGGIIVGGGGSGGGGGGVNDGGGID